VNSVCVEVEHSQSSTGGLSCQALPRSALRSLCACRMRAGVPRAEVMTPALAPFPEHTWRSSASQVTTELCSSVYTTIYLYLRAACQRETLKGNHQTERLEEGSGVGGRHFCQIFIQPEEAARPCLHSSTLTHCSPLHQSFYAPCKKQSS